MMILDLARRRGSRGAVPAGAAEPRAEVGDGAQLPFAGYQRLNARQVVDGLSDHTQVELKAVESYERSHNAHNARQPVFDKLRYLRGREPLPGYDALGDEEIRAAVETADLATVKRVRAYERKFRNRPGVLDAVDRLRRARYGGRVGRRAPRALPPDTSQ